MLDKIFGWGRKKDEPDPDISFGRYSDNNKPSGKIRRWTDADNLFRDKRYTESLDAFFDYLRDDFTQNVVYERNDTAGRFELCQGSKIVRGKFDDQRLFAEVTLVKMSLPSIPVMRRLLEMNFTLNYSRFALDNDRLCMRFDSEIKGATPTKLYYGLKELSIKADKQDDLLVQDFTTLETIDTDHLTDIPLQEKEIKYEWLQKWIKEVLDTMTAVDAEKFSGGISFILLALVFRIDYLLCPEGKLLNDLERMARMYFTKDERSPAEKNSDMADEFRKIQVKTKEEIFSYLFRSKHTFSVVAPQNHKAVIDSINAANQNMPWYRDNNYSFIASQMIEYGFSYCQYSFSLPRMISDFFYLYMRINYGGYFQALGFKASYYDPFKKSFDQESIGGKIAAIMEAWKSKYPKAEWRMDNLQFDTLVNFNLSFTSEITSLNMDM